MTKIIKGKYILQSSWQNKELKILLSNESISYPTQKYYKNKEKRHETTELKYGSVLIYVCQNFTWSDSSLSSLFI